MGVLGLWQILEAVGHPIKIEGIEGKRLAVDANIWLYKFVRGFREKDNAPNLESHKLGLFNRICKLLFYKIKPVFVFDGPAPILKRRTLERRQNIRNKELTKAQGAAMKLIAKQLQEQYPGADLNDIEINIPDLTSHNLVAAEKLTDEDRELFYLPPESQTIEEDVETEDESFVDSYACTGTAGGGGAIDIESKEFLEMPAEVRYEILQDIKDERKRLRRAAALPDNADSFSSLQLKRLMDRRSVQQKIEQCEKDICSMYTGETTSQSVRTYRIQSDATSTMVYLKAIGPVEKIKLEEETKKREENDESKAEEPANISSSSQESRKRRLMHSSPLDIKLKLPRSANLGSEHAMNLKEGSTICLTDSDDETDIETTNSFETEQTEDNKPNEASSCETSNQSVCDESICILSETGSSKKPSVEQVEKRSSETNSSDTEINTSSSTSHDLEPIDKSTADDQETTHPFSESRSIVEESDEEVIFENLKTMGKITNETVEIESDDSLSTVSSIAEICCEIPQSTTGKTDSLASSSDQSRPNIAAVDSTEKTQSPVVTEKEKEKVQETDSNKQLSQEPQRVQPSYSNPTTVNGNNLGPNQAAKVTTKVIEDAKELLRLFGIPYMDAAGEAEAQCALLEQLKLTEGTITDDSDIWLFGAQNVYRYFFNDDKYVMEYKMPEIEYHIRMNRENLVCFAMLVGSDYTDGIMNVGPVTALEILSEFPGTNLDSLIKFKNWKEKWKRSKDKVPGSKKREKFLKLHLPEDFPSRAVYEGYMRPMADSSNEKFVWGSPELDELREYARRNFDWDPKKVDEKLLPVIKKLNERRTQPRIDSYFFKTAANKNPELFRSKRVNEALNKIADTVDNEVEVCLTDEDDKIETAASQEKPKKKISQRGKKQQKQAKAAPAKKAKPATGASRKRRKE